MSKATTQNREGPEAPEAVSLADQPTVSLVQGDRLCVGCGFNLSGQRIVKEPRYGLLVAQCPECGAVAAMQEYPLLGKWAARWGAVLAGLWFLLISAAVVGGGAMLFGLTIGATQESAEAYAEVIVDRYEEDAAASQGGQSSGVRIWSSIRRDWWDAQDQPALLREAGGYREIIAPEAMPVWIAIGIVAFIIGSVAGVVMMHARGLRLASVALAPLAVGAAFASIAFGAMISSGAQTISPRDAALMQTWDTTAFICAALALLAMEAGLFASRPLARLAARVFLPPRLRSSLATLWITDGLDPPRPDGARSSA